MMGQGTAILTSSVGAGIVTAHKRMMQGERMSQGMSEGGAGALQQISNDAYTASVTMILNGVNAFLYQLVMLPLYLLVAFQKSVVCTANDIFGLMDASGFVMRVGRLDLQRASDVAAGVCLSAFYESRVNSITETESSQHLTQASDQFLRNAGQSGAAWLVSGSTLEGAKSLRILSLLGQGSLRSSSSTNNNNDNMAKLKSAIGDSAASKLKYWFDAAPGSQVPASVRNAATQGGTKAKTLFEQFKNNKIVGKLGSLIGKFHMKTPIHLVDSLITYMIGVVSGMQDMAQVAWLLLVGWLVAFGWVEDVCVCVCHRRCAFILICISADKTSRRSPAPAHPLAQALDTHAYTLPPPASRAARAAAAWLSNTLPAPCTCSGRSSTSRIPSRSLATMLCRTVHKAACTRHGRDACCDASCHSWD